MKNVSDKVVEKLKTHFLYSVTFFENLAVYEITWKRFVDRGKSHKAIWRMRIACWIPRLQIHTQVV